QFAKDADVKDLNAAIHHPKFAYALKERMDKLGIDCEVITDIRPGTEEWTKLTMDFVTKHLAQPGEAKRADGKREEVRIFNGKDLSGWVGHEHLWSVEDGEIVGKNSEPIAVSTYLLTERKFSDFRLVFD